jgi:hypothetical protein
LYPRAARSAQDANRQPRAFSNAKPKPAAGQAAEMEARCGRIWHAQCRAWDTGLSESGSSIRIWNEDVGYETLWRSEETYHPPAREGDDYGSWLTRSIQRSISWSNRLGAHRDVLPAAA